MGSVVVRKALVALAVAGSAVGWAPHAGADATTAAAIGGQLKGRACDPDDPGQLWWREGSGSSRVFVNDEFGTCLAYDGHERSPRLEACDFGDSDQRWYVNEQ